MKKLFQKKMAAASVVIVLFAGILSQGLVSELSSEKEALAQFSSELIDEGDKYKAVDVACPSTGVKGILFDYGNSKCPIGDPPCY